MGSVLVKTKGEGVETYTAPEEDWIVVKPGDRLGIYEKGSPPPGPGGVPHDGCNDGEQHMTPAISKQRILKNNQILDFSLNTNAIFLL